MAFRGRPSKGCQTCRTRRIKCDETRPMCEKCKVAGWSCPGYRQAPELPVRDETALVVHRQQASKVSRRKYGLPDAESVIVPTTSKPKPAHSLVIPSGLPDSLYDSAVGFFMINYVVQDKSVRKSSPNGDFNYLPILHKNVSSNDLLSIVVTAVGIASLSSMISLPDLLKPARQLYVRALQMTSKALSNPAEASSDRTLAAVVLLSVFESFTCPDRNSIKSWGQHIYGVARLIEYRGSEQFKTTPARKVFRLFRGYLFIRCLQMQDAAPCSLFTWTGQKNEELSEEESIIVISEELAALLASIKDEVITDPVTLVAKLLAIDEQLQEWKDSLPPEWCCHTVPLPYPANVTLPDYATHVDEFQDLWTTALWRSYYVNRLLVHERLLLMFEDIGARLSIKAGGNLERTHKVLAEMTDAICQSVPAGYRDNCEMKAISQPSFQTSNRSLLVGSLGHHFIWSLYFAGMLDSTQGSQRIWLSNQLKSIGVISGMRQAGHFSQMLYEKHEGNSPVHEIIYEVVDSPSPRSLPVLNRTPSPQASA